MTEPANSRTRPGTGQGVDFETLYRTQSSHVLRLMTHLIGPTGDVEDLAQEVFVIALRKLEQGDEIIAPRAWLEAISVRVASHARRTRWFKGMFGVANVTREEFVDCRAPDLRLEDKEDARELYRMLEKLTEKKRTSLILYELMDMTAVEIAATMECPVNTVYARLRHARAELLELRTKSRVRGAFSRGP